MCEFCENEIYKDSKGNFFQKQTHHIGITFMNATTELNLVVLNIVHSAEGNQVTKMKKFSMINEIEV